MKFILFFFCLFAIYTSSKLRRGPRTYIDSFAASDTNSGALNSGVGAATSVAVGLAQNFNVATNVDTNVRMGDVNVRAF